MMEHSDYDFEDRTYVEVSELSTDVRSPECTDHTTSIPECCMWPEDSQFYMHTARQSHN
jgi:hypothetical protein